VADSEILRSGGQKTMYQPHRHLPGIANANNELYAFYTGKGSLLKKFLSR